MKVWTFSLFICFLFRWSCGRRHLLLKRLRDTTGPNLNLDNHVFSYEALDESEFKLFTTELFKAIGSALGDSISAVTDQIVTDSVGNGGSTTELLKMFNDPSNSVFSSVSSDFASTMWDVLSKKPSELHELETISKMHIQTGHSVAAAVGSRLVRNIVQTFFETHKSMHPDFNGVITDILASVAETLLAGSSNEWKQLLHNTFRKSSETAGKSALTASAKLVAEKLSLTITEWYGPLLIDHTFQAMGVSLVGTMGAQLGKIIYDEHSGTKKYSMSQVAIGTCEIVATEIAKDVGGQVFKHVLLDGAISSASVLAEHAVCYAGGCVLASGVCGVAKGLYKGNTAKEKAQLAASAALQSSFTAACSLLCGSICAPLGPIGIATGTVIGSVAGKHISASICRGGALGCIKEPKKIRETRTYKLMKSLLEKMRFKLTKHRLEVSHSTRSTPHVKNVAACEFATAFIKAIEGINIKDNEQWHVQSVPNIVVRDTTDRCVERNHLEDEDFILDYSGKDIHKMFDEDMIELCALIESAIIPQKLKTLHAHEFAAITSFVYNTGMERARKKGNLFTIINEKENNEIVRYMREQVYAFGREQPELVGRRKKEILCFTTQCCLQERAVH